MTMVEIVARAISAQMSVTGPDPDPLARAAIGAMLNPTVEMQAAAITAAVQTERLVTDKWRENGEVREPIIAELAVGDARNFVAAFNAAIGAALSQDHEELSAGAVSDPAYVNAQHERNREMTRRATIAQRPDGSWPDQTDPPNQIKPRTTDVSMYDCEKCWETPCVCGYEYSRPERWPLKRLNEFADMIERVRRERVAAEPPPNQQPNPEVRDE